MASLDDIDFSLPVNFTPVRPPKKSRAVEDDVPLAEGVMFSGADAAVFWAWLCVSDHVEAVEMDLQSMSQTTQGAPLLTTWLEWEEFMALVDSARRAHALPDMASTLASWSDQGALRVYIDGFAKM